MLRSTPPGEDPVGDARVSRVGFFAQGAPPGEDGLARRSLGEDGMNNLAGQGDLYQRTLDAATPPGAAEESAPESRGEVDYLHLIRIAEPQANLYVQHVNRRAWSRPRGSAPSTPSRVRRATRRIHPNAPPPR